MAMTTAGKAGGGFDVDSVLNFEKRSGIKDGEIEDFITKVDAVNAAIQAMKDGEVDPADVHVDGVPTIEEERQMEEEKRRRRLELARREQENRERQRQQENEKWWRGAELLYGERKQLSWTDALKKSISGGSARVGLRGSNELDQAPPATRSLTEEERARLKERYSMEYSRWETWTPSDPATLAELKEREEEEDNKRSKDFEETNPDFCKQMVDDMKSRSEASEKKESAATAARLKGNRFYKAKRWEKALELYMTSLKAKPYAVNALANVAQTLIKLERWPDAVEFCDRALHVDEKCVKALSRRASAFVKLAGGCRPASLSADVHTAVVEAAPTTAEAEVVNADGGGTTGDSVDVGGLTASENANETISAADGGSARGTTGQGQGGETRDRYGHYGGRDGLLALALQDLNAAAEADPGGEDVGRQRDSLRREIEEEKAEAEVMKRARQASRETSSSRHVPARHEAEPGGADPSSSPDAASKKASAAKPEDRGSQHVDGPTKTSALPSPNVGSEEAEGAEEEEEEEDGLRTIDRLLEEGLGLGRKCSREPETATATEAKLAGNRPGAAEHLKALQRHPLLRLTAILEDDSTARVYFRASGGLGRLAGATATAARCWDDSIESAASSGCQQTNGTGSPASPPLSAGVDFTGDGAGVASGGKTDARIATAQLEEDRATFALMLRTVSAALKGAERLAQQEVSKSGLLGAPCAQAMRGARRGGAAAAGAAALLLSRVVDDVSVRTRVARSADLLSGLVGLMAAGSMLPVDVESAATSLRAVLIGRTATIAANTLSDAAATARKASTGAEEAERTRTTGWPATAVGEALLLWMAGDGLMQGAPASTGSALCSVLANLAMNEQFRGSFARPLPPVVAAGSGPNAGKASTVAAVLVLVAGDMTADRSEARTVALAALANACLHNPSVQTATLSAGGLALALATLSLEGNERTRFVPPLVAARSAGLLARLCSLPAALEAMARPGAVDRIIRATVRSSTLGGNLFATSTAPLNHPDEAAENYPADAAAAEIAGARVTERENLVRTLGSILRSKRPSTPAVDNGTRKVGSTAPSSNVPAVAVPEDAMAHLAATAEKLELAGALVSFLPPARGDGAEGVTIASVALRPGWCAPPAVTANVCVCLLHLLDGELSGRIAEQVVASDGIPRLISLFANSGGGGGALSARTNAAICLAKLAREPRHKQMIADLRGMEMLVQAGAGLA